MIRIFKVSLMLMLVQCAGNFDLPDLSEPQPTQLPPGTNQPVEETDLSDDIINAVENLFLKEQLYKLKKGQSVVLINPSGGIPLAMQVADEPHQNLEILKYLAQKGIPLDTPNSYDLTVLDWMAAPDRIRPKSSQVIEYLVKQAPALATSKTLYGAVNFVFSASSDEELDFYKMSFNCS